MILGKFGKGEPAWSSGEEIGLDSTESGFLNLFSMAVFLMVFSLFLIFIALVFNLENVLPRFKALSLSNANFNLVVGKVKNFFSDRFFIDDFGLFMIKRSRFLGVDPSFSLEISSSESVANANSAKEPPL